MSSPVCCSRKQQHVWENNPVSHTFPQQAMTGTHSCLTGTQSLTSSGPTITVSADEGLKRRLPLLLYCVSMCVFLYIRYFDCLSASQFEVGINRLGVLRRCTHSDTKVKCRTLKYIWHDATLLVHNATFGTALLTLSGKNHILWVQYNILMGLNPSRSLESHCTTGSVLFR